MPIDFEVLAYDETRLGVLCLRRRRTVREPRQWVTEVTLNHEFLMSSLHTDSERALASIALQHTASNSPRVLVGGLGLGYTTASALDDPRVSQVQVVELLPQVIGWLQDGLIPLSERLQADSRLAVIQGDVYQYLLSKPVGKAWDAILIDVDHSPDDQLSSSDHGLYSQTGIAKASQHLCPGGVLALWSYEGNQQLEHAMRQVFSRVEIVPITYENQHVSESFTDWLFVGKCE